MCRVPAFEASQYLITNGEYLQFVVDGGYTRRDLWTTEGWQWVQARQARHPSFWICSHGYFIGLVFLLCTTIAGRENGIKT